MRVESTMRVGVRAACAVSVMVTAALAQAPASEIDFETLASDFRVARCAGEATALHVEDVLARHFARLRVGGFEVDYPVEFLTERKRPEELREVVIALIDLQEGWLKQLMQRGSDRNAMLDDLASVRSWVADWEPRELRRVGRGEEGVDLYTSLEAPVGVRAAQERVDALLHDPERLGLAMRTDKTARLILCPTRRDFMRWLAFAGLVEPERRSELYVDGCDQWTQFWTGWNLVLAMEYASWSGFDPRFRAGKSMKSFEDSGLVEQITLQAGMALVRTCTNRDPLHAENALVMNLVIDFVGQINTIDGEGQIQMSGARTQPYSRFVPGGNPNGGTLPKRSARGRNRVVKSQWRKDNGEDYFFAVLAKGQSKGARQARKDRRPRYDDTLAHFRLESSRGKWVVSAPFFGAHAADQAYPPQEFLNDYAEFFRAYKTAFYRWLRTAAIEPATGRQPSRETFRELLERLDEVAEPSAYEELFGDVYGVPLSAADGSTDSMEWRFLRALADGA